MYYLKLLIALIFLSPNLNAQDLKLKEKKGLYGFFLDKKMIINYQFDTVESYYGKRFFVRKEGLWGVVSIDSIEMIPCEYESIQGWMYNEYLVSNNGLYGIIDSAGLVKWDLKYQEIDHTKGDSIALVKEEGVWILNDNGVLNYNEDDFYFVRPDVMPLFPGCNASLPYKERESCSVKLMYKYIFENIHYPAMARDKGIQGMVIIQFIIDKNGKIHQPKILRGLGGGINEVSIKLIQEMPVWIPGVEDDKIVQTTFTLPIKFVLK